MEVHFANDFISERPVSGGGPGVFSVWFCLLYHIANCPKIEKTASLEERNAAWVHAQCVASGGGPMRPQYCICRPVLPHAVRITNTGCSGNAWRRSAPLLKTPVEALAAGGLCLQSLLAIAAVAVPTAAGLLLLQPLLFRRLQVRHILTVLPQHTASVDLAAKPL